MLAFTMAANHVFAGAERVLAQHFQEEAKSELRDQKTTMAGEDLDAAASALNGSSAWSGQACTEECAKSIADARRVSEALLTPVAAANTEGGASHQQADAGKAGATMRPSRLRRAQRSIGIRLDRAARIRGRRKVTDELGKAIESVGSKAEPAQTEQHSSTDAKTNNPRFPKSCISRIAICEARGRGALNGAPRSRSIRTRPTSRVGVVLPRCHCGEPVCKDREEGGDGGFIGKAPAKVASNEGPPAMI